MSDEAQTETPSRRMPKWMFGLGFVAAGLGVMSSGFRANDNILVGTGGALALTSLFVMALLFFKR